MTPFPSSWASLLVLAATAAGMSACMHLFVSLKRKIQTLENVCSALQEAQADLEKESRARTAGVEERLRAEEQRAAILTPPAPPRSGLNLNKRTHVMRLARRGERAGAIASTLQLPRAEVELLLKVEKWNSEIRSEGDVRGQVREAVRAQLSG